MAGRPRKDTALKLLQGTAQKCRLNPDEPKKSPHRPVCPDQLGPEARAHFELLTERMAERGYATASYTEIIVHAARLYEQTLDGPDMLVKLANAYRTALSELGLTPASSSKVVVKQQRTEDQKSKWAL